MKILVSACLLGINCKYSGGNNYSEALARLAEEHELIPVCPEVLGGLPVPRTPAELVHGVVTAKDGTIVDKEFRRGAEEALRIALEKEADLAVLQSRSPSCGPREIYDGTFSGRRIPGKGVFAALLSENGIRILDIEELEVAGSSLLCTVPDICGNAEPSDKVSENPEKMSISPKALQEK